MAKKYIILKVLNNNSLLVQDNNSETIIIGKGIGFKQKVGDIIYDTSLVEKEYHLISEEDSSNNLIIQNTAAIVDIVNKNVEGEISEHSFLSLTNHVRAMLIRVENDEIFPNPFHHETVTLYGESYKVSLDIADKVERAINIRLPEAEIDFLTLYIHSIVSSYDSHNTALRNAIISDVSDTIEIELNFDLDKSSAFYARFVTHLKFLIERLTKDEPLESVPMVENIASQFPEYMEVSAVIANIIEKHLDSKLSMDEHMYIALHIARLTLNNKKGER